MAKINYIQLDEEEYFPKAEKFKKAKPTEGDFNKKSKPKIKKPVKQKR